MLLDEPANRFVIYESRIKSSLRLGAPMTTYLNQILSHIRQSGKKIHRNRRDKKDGGEKRVEPTFRRV